MSEMMIYLGSLQDFESDEPLLDDIRDISIFSMGCMLVLIAYLDSSLKIESDEYDLVDMQRIFYF
jgi:hypothetical protein